MFVRRAGLKQDEGGRRHAAVDLEKRRREASYNNVQIVDARRLFHQVIHTKAV